MVRIWSARLLKAATFLAAYLVSARILQGQAAFSQAVLWLPTGVAVSGLWLLGPAYWPVIALATVLHRLSLHYPVTAMFPGVVGNPLEALVAVALLRRFGFRPDLRRLHDVLVLLAAALVAPMVGALLGRSAWFIHHDRLSFLRGLLGWWRMNALGILVVVPFLLPWTVRPLPHPARRALLEIATITVAVAALVGFLLRVDAAKDQGGMVLSYLALPLALYAAVRFGPRGGATAAAGVVVAITLATVMGIGPFVAPPTTAATPYVREYALQAVIAIMMVTPVMFGAVIAERETAQAAIAAERERRRELIESINRNVNEGIFRISPEQGLVFVSAGLARMLGFDAADQLVGRPPFDMFADDAQREALKERIRTDSDLHNEEILLRRRDGTTFPALVRCTGVRDAAGRLVFCDGAVTDISVHARLEEQLRQAQKMEALGKLAGGVAHDFNNLLTAIGGYAELLGEGLPPGSRERRDAGEISGAVARAAGLTRQLLAYSRRQLLAPQVIDLREIVDHLGNMLRRLIGEDVQLVSRHGAREARVRVDRGQIEQVILNLVLNARDAMPAGGTLTISTGLVRREDLRSPAAPGLESGPYVCLSVADTGMGMSPEVIERAFDPFFTTKEMGKGTGLGLSTVHGIVLQSGGTVWIESAPGSGTTVRVCLPAATEAREGAAREPAPAAASPASGTILVVEDEPSVRELVARALRGAGYSVLEAADGEQGLEIARRAGGAIDLVIADVVMPRLGGPQLHARLEALSPGIPVLFISGYANQALPDPARAASELILKPFTPAALLERVRAVLDAPAPVRDVTAA